MCPIDCHRIDSPEINFVSLIFICTFASSFHPKPKRGKEVGFMPSHIPAKADSNCDRTY